MPDETTGETLKAVYVARFKDGSSRAEGSRYWTDVHAPMAHDLDDMVRYIQSHVVGPPAGQDDGEIGFDGYASEWWRSRVAFETGMQTDAWRRIVDDGPEVFDMASLGGSCVVVRERILRDGPAAPYKVASFVRFKEGIDRVEASAHWSDVHGPLVLGAPGVRRYVQNVVSGTLGNDGSITTERARFDGFAEMWFEGEAAYARCRESAAWEALTRDGANFLETAGQGPSMNAVVEERTIKPR